jgi:hypothetical protein
MMLADDNLPTRLTYGVKGPHTICREVEGEGWTTSLPPLANKLDNLSFSKGIVASP